MQAFLDIETTGLSLRKDTVTIVGIGTGAAAEMLLTQLVGKDITLERILLALNGTQVIYTYNGWRFDLPFIKQSLGLDLSARFKHHDLMLDCWEKGLFGGLKVVEMALGIPRRLNHMDGRKAAKLWMEYSLYRDEEALRLLLRYNREDVCNLKALKEKMESKRNPWGKGESWATLDADCCSALRQGQQG